MEDRALCEQIEQFQPEEAPEAALHAIRAWNMMGGAIDWSALEIVVEIIGVQDVESFVAQLTALRDHQEAAAKTAAPR